MGQGHRIPFSDIARRITGLSTPFFGVSWTPPEDSREVARRLIAFMEDRRALYADYNMEYGPWVGESVIQMRSELTRILQSCPEEVELTEPIRAMRAACRKFLDDTGRSRHLRRAMYPYDGAMWLALGQLRGICGLHLARVCAAYGVDAEPDLASMFPEGDDDREDGDA